jgi:hypothetical protein
MSESNEDTGSAIHVPNMDIDLPGFALYEGSDAPMQDADLEQRSIPNHGSVDLHDEYAPRQWLRTVRVKCTRREIWSGEPMGRLIDRDLIKGHFWEYMQNTSPVVGSIVFEVFDRYGCLMQELKDHTIRKGTSPWDDELSHDLSSSSNISASVLHGGESGLAHS